ncbi:MAG: aspartate kinase [Rickettsiaceae bacterium H1]|nr:aspartate kinase [Rickettsiaceae bacterium H1]
MIIVQKFGGTSLATVEHVKRVSSFIKKEIDSGNQVVVVVSAMGNFTDVLAGYANSFFSDNLAEQDVILAAGEQITSGLLALYLSSIGINARSWLGWQIPVHTDGKHTKAEIIKINTANIKDCLSKGIVSIIAGFQGVNENNRRITTIGRGGSDVSAVEVAVSINADRCDIYTDVDGVYTADPGLVPQAKKLSVITYDEMLEMSAMGAKVLHTNSVESAMQNQMKTRVLSSFNHEPGTLLVNKEDNMKNKPVTAVTCNNDEACITISSVKTPSKIFSPLAEAAINVNIIVRNLNANNLTFTVGKNDLEKTLNILKEYEPVIDDKISIISIIGVGMFVNSGVACKMFKALEENNIEILAITTSEIKISVVLHQEYRELAVRLLHTTHGLDADEIR